jgi:co-chaperonin GroES (HSP10)
MMTTMRDLIEKAAKAYPGVFDWDMLKNINQDDLPNPALWHMLVLPAMPKTKTKGGIYLADTTQEAETYNNTRSLVLAVGELAYKGERFKAHPEASKMIRGCKPGDFVMHGKYAGQRIKIGGVLFMILPDDEITATITNPAAIAAYI